MLDAWLPLGHTLPDGARCELPLVEGNNWQIVQTQGHGRALLVSRKLGEKWVDAGLIDPGTFDNFRFGERAIWSLSSGPSQNLSQVCDGKSPETKSEALAFALALKATRSIDKQTPLQDALYVEKISRLLPTYGISSRTDDETILGYWLTGGANISAKSFRRLRLMLSWMDASHVKDVVATAGFQVTETVLAKPSQSLANALAATIPSPDEAAASGDTEKRTFDLPGRPSLAAFFNEHVIDIVQNRARYQALGIGFPSAIVLNGPPGCGKTFAVEKLVDFLGWPSFQIDASSVASPYIHETSRKVADVFSAAMENAPSVLIIDEMESFLADRELGSGHHRVEEVAEFLRRIPEAAKNDVLILGMTNRVEMIDPAILRRGRFDHVIKVDFANETEVLALLDTLLSSLPTSVDVMAGPLAEQLAGRPLSDVAFVVREAARLAARSGKEQLDQDSLLSALRAAPAREREGSEKRRIGFI